MNKPTPKLTLVEGRIHYDMYPKRNLIGSGNSHDDNAFIIRAVNAHDELVTALKVCREFLDMQNKPRDVMEQIAFRNAQLKTINEAIAKAEGK